MVERLSAVDTSFLVLESPRTPMHIAVVVTMERGPVVDEDGRIRLDAIRHHVAARLHLAPKLRQVVRSVPGNLARPVWVDDPDLDLSHHIRLLELPSGDHALEDLVDQLIAAPVDRARPLWEWWIIDGVGEDRIVIVEKLHHSLIDGVSGVQLLGALTDLAPADDGAWVPRPAPSRAELIGAALADQAREPWRIADGMWRSARMGSIARLAGAAGAIVRSAVPSLLAPASMSVNQRVSPGRRLRSLSLSLAETKRIAHAHDTKVNDVVLTVVSGGLRALLQSRGESVASHALHALVPENVRTVDEHLALGNRVSGFLVALPVHEADAERTLECITTSMRHKHATHEDDTATDLLGVADHAPAGLVRALGGLVHQQPWVNTVVTNVPGPRVDLTMMGARITSMVPVVPLSGNLAVGVAVLSYGDDLRIGVNTCREACPDIDVMIGAMRATFDALTASAAVEPSLVRPRRGGRPRRGDLPDQPRRVHQRR